MTKVKLLVLSLSLGANAALAAWLLLKPAATSSASAAPDEVRAEPTPAAPAPVDPLTQPITAETWAQLATLPDEAYVRRLKLEGMSPAMIRSLLHARIAARHAERFAALNPPGKDEYWRRSFRNFGQDLTPEARRERRQLGREINDSVKAAMGADYEAASPYERTRRERTYGPIASDKAAQIQAITSDYNELRAAVNDQTQGVTLPEDRAQLRLLEEEQRADLAAVLTPEELLEYDLRNSPASMRTRSLLAYFDPSEEEFRALAQQRLAFDRQFGGNYLSEEEQARKRTAEAGLLAQARAVLSPERFAEYELVANEDFRNTATTLSRFNFDQTVAREVFQLRRDITARAAAIEAQSLYTPEQRAAELAALYREASSALTTRLGPEAYTNFERQGPGNWLRKLKPAAPGGTAR